MNLRALNSLQRFVSAKINSNSYDLSWYKTVSWPLLILNPQVLFCYLSFSDCFKKHPKHLCNFRIEFTNLSSFFPVNLVTVFYSVFYAYVLRRGGLREKNKQKKKKRKPKHSWVNAADIFEIIVLLSSCYFQIEWYR